MTINEIFNNLEEDMLEVFDESDEALFDVIEEELLSEVKQAKGWRWERHAFTEYKNDGREKFKAGRERTVSAVMNRVKKKGGSVSSNEARNYIYKVFDDWSAGNPEKWLANLEKATKKKTGFNPRKYSHAMPGATSGKANEPGRAYFFVGFLNGLANHFLKEQGKELYKPGERNNEKKRRPVYRIKVALSANGKIK